MIGIADTTITLTLPPLDQLLILLLVGLFVGLVAELIVGMRAPLGFLGAVILGMLGAWIAGHVLHFTISPEYTINGVPLFRSLIGAVILALIWVLVVRGAGRRTAL
ncbi:MAG: GlsB/YeaQ/YmgE family stress response membrane protein [Thermomicrobia bacterium]|nr:GlsB/YeaQ/YmgE family stress response membrane protein [Thermomicrobia bacterium]